MATLPSSETLLQGNFLQRKIRIQRGEVREDERQVWGWLEARGHQSRGGVGSKRPCSPESAISGPQRLDSVLSS